MSVSLPHHHDHTAVEMPEHAEFEAAGALFKLLGDASRLRIFWVLCHCEACVVNVAAMVNMSSPAVSHHLRQLRASGLITARRDGKEVFYRAADSDTVQQLHRMIETMVQIACPVMPGDGTPHAAE